MFTRVFTPIGNFIAEAQQLCLYYTLHWKQAKYLQNSKYLNMYLKNLVFISVKYCAFMMIKYYDDKITDLRIYIFPSLSPRWLLGL